MKKLYFFLLLTAILSLYTEIQAQDTAGLANKTLFMNSAERMLATEGKLTIGGYGQIDYNQPLDGDIRQNGKLDVHRLVMLFGYRFNHRTQFITEIEYEHVKEVYIEQAFLQYKITNCLNFRGGLLLVPMGIINEYHEPTTFNGVERPHIDHDISPTTWREIGAGFTGNIIPVSLRYQAYVVNGFNGYDGNGQLGGKDGLRGGRQKGAESFMSAPNLTGKVEYYGIYGLNIGLSAYAGNTQSTAYNGIDKNDDVALATADSSVVGFTMVGLDARFQRNGIEMRGQFYYGSLSNTAAYNYFTAQEDGTLNDLGSALLGYYIEGGYNVLQTLDNISTELVPFVRYSVFNTHHDVAVESIENDAYDREVITTGLGWKMANGAVLKADMQFIKSTAGKDYATTFNAGVGVMF